jgi:hypothetical protein
VVQVADIPRTKSGKIVELAVKKRGCNGQPVKNVEALANPKHSIISGIAPSCRPSSVSDLSIALAATVRETEVSEENLGLPLNRSPA